MHRHGMVLSMSASDGTGNWQLGLAYYKTGRWRGSQALPAWLIACCADQGASIKRKAHFDVPSPDEDGADHEDGKQYRLGHRSRGKMQRSSLEKVLQPHWSISRLC